MRMRRFSAAITAVAASALVLSACTSGDAPTTPETDGTATEAPDDTTDGEEGDGDTGEAGDASDACLQPLGITETAAGEVSYTAGDVDWAGYNSILSSTYSTYNSVIAGQMASGFIYFGVDGTICENDTFGTFEIVSGLDDDAPLVIEYTISDDAVWSDGTPITINDYLYDWATQNPEFLVPGYADGSDPEAKPVFNHVSSSFPQYVPEGPVGEVGSKTFTVEYNEKYPDWKLVIGSALPAHVAAEQSGLTADELAQAIIDRDADTVAQTADFWNNWLSPVPGELPDPAVAPSSGPYQLKAGGWVAGEYLTLEANPNWWGEPAATENLVYRFIAADQVPTSMANNELNVVDPQATVDTLDQLAQLGDQVKVDTGDTLTWEHLDFNFGQGGEVENEDGTTTEVAPSVFADNAGGLAAREAFALCAPRQTIIDTLIAPINNDAVVMNAREVFPFQENYEAVVAAAYDGRYDQVDIAAAQAKLEESGLTTPVEVVIGYQAPNPRRADQIAAIKSSCDEAGFNIVDGGSDVFFQTVMPAGDYDVALFAWAGSGQIASGQNIYVTNNPQNYGQYSNAEVDAAWKTLASTLDPAAQLEQIKIIEKLLWDDLFGIPVFAHPGVTAYTSGLENVRHTATQDQGVWNASQWAWAN